MLDPRVTVRLLGGGPFAREGHGADAAFASPEEPRLVRLRERYRLESVVAGGRSDLERIVALRGWVRRALGRHGWSYSLLPVQPSGTETVLEEAARGTLFNCGFHAEVLLDCAAALGYPSRIAGLAMRDQAFPADRRGNVGHTVTEVWLGDLQRWAVMDADANVHYELDGEPLSSARMCARFHADGCRGVRAVYGSDRPSFDDRHGRNGAVAGTSWNFRQVRAQEALFLARDAMDYYQLVGVVERPVGADRDIFTVYLPDGVEPPLVLDGAPYDFHPDVFTRDPRVLDRAPWPTRLHVAGLDTSGPSVRLDLGLSCGMPAISHFEVTEEDGAPREARESILAWEFAEGRRALRVKAVNRFGVAGGEARIAVEARRE